MFPAIFQPQTPLRPVNQYLSAVISDGPPGSGTGNSEDPRNTQTGFGLDRSTLLSYMVITHVGKQPHRSHVATLSCPLRCCTDQTASSGIGKRSHNRYCRDTRTGVMLGGRENRGKTGLPEQDDARKAFLILDRIHDAPADPREKDHTCASGPMTHGTACTVGRRIALGDCFSANPFPTCS